MNKQFWLSLVLVFCVASFISFFYIGNLPLLDPDEPVYAETAREMLQYYDYISPRIYHEFWYDKPPMYYWLVAGAFKTFGVGEFAARFPSALLAVAGTLLVYLGGRKLFNNRAGLLAALVLATSMEYFYLAKAAVTDITLTFFLTAALLAFWDKRYYWFYTCCALAVLTKGPIGVVFPVIIGLLYLLMTRSLAEIKKMKVISGSMLLGGVALPWYAAMVHYHGQAFIDTFLGFHNITRFLQPEHANGVLWYYYIPVLIIGFFPWTAFMPQALYAAIRQQGEAGGKPVLFLTIWAVVVFLFFSVSQTKLISYILPMYPALALLTGWYIDKIWAQDNRKAFLVAAGLLTLFIIILAAAIVYGVQQIPALLFGAQLAGAVFLLVPVLVWWMVIKRNYQKALTAQVAGMILFVIVLMTSLFPAIAPGFSMREFSSHFKEQYDGQAPVYITKFYRPGFMFYTGIPGQELKGTSDLAEAMQGKQKVYFIIKNKEYERLAPEVKSRLVPLNVVEDKILLLKNK